MNLEECESECLRKLYVEDGSDTKYLATVLAIGSECEYVILGHDGGGCLEVAVAGMVVGQWRGW
ncbi:hypothetical protein Hanom_Chr11g01001621 [Helianthus anomalus]